MNNFSFYNKKLNVIFKRRTAKIDQGLSAVTAPVAVAATRQGVTAGGEGMLPTGAAIAMRSGAGSLRVEAMGDPGFEAEQATHHRAPFMAMGTGEMAVFQMMDQPVSHFVGHHLDQKGQAVLAVEHRVEAQAATPEMGLAGAAAAQVAPDPRPGKMRMDLPTQPPGGLHPLAQRSLELRRVERSQAFGIGMGQGGVLHGVLEWPLVRRA